MASRFRNVFPEDVPIIGLVEPPAVSQTVTELEAFAEEMEHELGQHPSGYQLNLARLALADRHELLRRATPLRERGKLDATFNRFYASLFDRARKLERPELSPPPVEVPAPVPTPASEPKRRTVEEALSDALIGI